MDERSERIARRFEIPILVAALLVVPVIFIEESPRIGEPWTTIAAVLNWAIWLAFLAELVVMLAVVPDRWRWLREHPLEVVVVVLTPPFLPASLQAARVLRLLRLVRLVRTVQVVRRLFTIDGLRYAALLAFVTLLGGGTAFAAVEKTPTAWDGIWWAISTMTTVGYGDITPETNAGRVIGIVVMTVGIGFGTVVRGRRAALHHAGGAGGGRRRPRCGTGGSSTRTPGHPGPTLRTRSEDRAARAVACAITDALCLPDVRTTPRPSRPLPSRPEASGGLLAGVVRTGDDVR